MLITGHTGFKGTWMTFLCEQIGIPVVGYSLEPVRDSLFDRANRRGKINEKFANILDPDVYSSFVQETRPSVVLHMAAQPLVLESYKNPESTFEVNVMGTVNVLRESRKNDFILCTGVVTTDKVYENLNDGRKYVESDPLLGGDPYSASKVATEAVVRAWQKIDGVEKSCPVVSLRAGNVIGGGDFAEDRIIPDLIRGALSNSTVIIRNRSSTRPWQHVLDPLYGYLMAIEHRLNGGPTEAINFGPIQESLSVENLVSIAMSSWPERIRVEFMKSTNTREAQSLQLNSNLAQSVIGWEPVWNQEEAIRDSVLWWKRYSQEKMTASEACKQDILKLLELKA